MDVNKRLVKPGGLFIMEGYTIDQIALSSGGPKKPEMMMSDAGLRKTFADFDILLLQETRRLLSEGPRHQGDAYTSELSPANRPRCASQSASPSSEPACSGGRQ